MAFSFNSYSYTDIVILRTRTYIDERSLHSFNCTVNSTSLLIWALCNLPGSSFAAGIQVIVQSTNVSEVHKLYVNQSMDLNTPVAVPVERDGKYHISIFAIREGMGILESTWQYDVMTSVATTVQGVVSTSSQPRSDLSATEESGRH